MERLIHLVIPGHAVPKGRPRFASAGKFVRTYTPAKTAKYEALVRERAIAAIGSSPPTDRPVAITVLEVRNVPTSWPKWKRAAALLGTVFPTARPDIDNIEKSICDALNSVLWLDDSQIVEKHSRKVYGLEPRVELTVEAFTQG